MYSTWNYPANMCNIQYGEWERLNGGTFTLDWRGNASSCTGGEASVTIGQENRVQRRGKESR